MTGVLHCPWHALGTPYGCGDPALARLRTWNLRHSATGTHTAASPTAAIRSRPATGASGLFALLPATPASTTPASAAAPAARFPHPGQLSGELAGCFAACNRPLRAGMLRRRRPPGLLLRVPGQRPCLALASRPGGTAGQCDGSLGAVAGDEDHAPDGHDHDHDRGPDEPYRDGNPERQVHAGVAAQPHSDTHGQAGSQRNPLLSSQMMVLPSPATPVTP
jgi:hypothetical protein